MSSKQCISIRGKEFSKERCPYKAKAGESWCGHHIKQKQRTVFIAVKESPPSPKSLDPAASIAAAWRRYIARRAGPLLWFRGESNNPADFYTTEPVEEIPLRSFISFVDGVGKGYIMDIASAISLIDHVTKTGEQPMNPFNRAPLSDIFLRRILRHGQPKATNIALPPSSDTTITTDLFRTMEDLGYYTDPTWFSDLDHIDLVRLYIELAHIWYTSAGLRPADRARIVPIQTRFFTVPVRAIGQLDRTVLKQMVIEVCKLFVSSAVAQSDRQLGVMYVIGALALLHRGARQAYPWMFESVTPGVTRHVGNGQLAILHPAALDY